MAGTLIVNSPNALPVGGNVSIGNPTPFGNITSPGGHGSRVAGGSAGGCRGRSGTGHAGPLGRGGTGGRGRRLAEEEMSSRSLLPEGTIRR